MKLIVRNIVLETSSHKDQQEAARAYDAALHKHNIRDINMFNFPEEYTFE